jgi:quinol monooxygenase YgiN
MSITIVTHLHAAHGQDQLLAELAAEGRTRMRAADGCESFDLLRDEDDPCALAFLQRWVSHEAHDTAFAERIAQTGHLDKVLAALDKPIAQHTYGVVS